MRKITNTSSIILAFVVTLMMGTALAQPSESRYVIKGGQVYDQKTKLTWQRCSVGQRWGGKTRGCVGSVKLVNFGDAQKLGHGSWRVPSKDELATLVDVSKIGNSQKPPMIDEAAFPNMDLTHLVYWTSTSDKKLFAWTVIFGESESYIYSGPRKQLLAVRLVRGEK
ncbi:MAG: Lcl C-terminal domain-containing protein [Burkholderiaceae bacterium]